MKPHHASRSRYTRELLHGDIEQRQANMGTLTDRLEPSSLEQARMSSQIATDNLAVLSFSKNKFAQSIDKTRSNTNSVVFVHLVRPDIQHHGSDAGAP